MKKTISVLLAIMMMFTAIGMMPASAYAKDAKIKTVNVKTEKEFYDKIAGGYTGASFQSSTQGETHSFTLTLNNEAYVLISVSSRCESANDSVMQTVTLANTAPAKEIFSHFISGKIAGYDRIEKLAAGNYTISVTEEWDDVTNTTLNVGLFNANTEFLTASYVKTVKNSGNQSMVIKVNALDTISELYADNSNYGYVSGVKTVGKPYTPDANGCITVPVESYNKKAYPYFTILTEDIYGIEHEYWFGALTPETAQFTGIKNKVYGGSAIKQSFKVECFNDVPTYKVTYSNNVNVGTAKLTITGFGRWSGTVTKSFKINPKGTSLGTITPGSKKMTVRWKKQATQTTGYEIQYSLSSKFKKAKKATVKKNSTVKKVIKKLKSNKKYYVRVRTYKVVGSKKYYSKWSKKKAVTIK